MVRWVYPGISYIRDNEMARRSCFKEFLSPYKTILNNHNKHTIFIPFHITDYSSNYGCLVKKLPWRFLSWYCCCNSSKHQDRFEHSRFVSLIERLDLFHPILAHFLLMFSSIEVANFWKHIFSCDHSPSQRCRWYLYIIKMLQ